MEMLVQQTCAQRMWTAGACYSWGSHCPYLKISIGLYEILALLCKGGMHFAATVL